MEFAFEFVVNLVAQVHVELVPKSLRLSDRGTFEVPEWFEERRESLQARVRMMDTDGELRQWLHMRASRKTMIALDLAMHDLSQFLLDSKADRQSARNMVAEIVGCPTLLNVARLALRGPVDS